MTLAFASGPVGVILTDCRRGVTFGDGTEHYEDGPGRLLSVAGGWLTGTGQVFLVERGIKAVARCGISDPAEVIAVLDDVWARERDRILKACPADEELLSKTSFVWIAGSPMGLVARAYCPSDRRCLGGRGDLITTYPPGISPIEQTQIEDQIENAIRMESTPEGVARAFAVGLTRVSNLTHTVSPLTNIGVLYIDERGSHSRFIRSDCRLLPRAPLSLISSLYEPPPPAPLAGLTGSLFAGIPRVESAHAVTDAIKARHVAALTVEVGKFIQSTGYVPGTTGWKISGNGDVDFNNANFRGSLTLLITGSQTVEFQDGSGVPQARINGIVPDGAGNGGGIAISGYRTGDPSGDTRGIINIQDQLITIFSDQKLMVEGDIGFFGTSPISKPTVTGSVGGNAALGSVIGALESLGLITNSASA